MASQSHKICVADSSSSRHLSQVGSSLMSGSEIYNSVCTYFISEYQSLKCRLLDLIRLGFKLDNGHCDALLPIGERVRLGIFDEVYFS
jgi:hypothetical protein